ncbi:DMT family transporter [Pantoea sp. Mhis]|uniref:DMT family transporter n=1 Tax=Pantoea sp. Mhis TaxID=2576759 RepID=UPI00135AA9A2|nr:DMT family transporter [Pantoea sp. Mhis]MXP56507.1 DMT family transporter [Pantoea sp. Mhis]
MQKIIISFLFIIVALTWGTTWLAMKIAIETVPPIFATGMRFLCASPFLIFIAWITKKPLIFPIGYRFFQLLVSLFYFAIPFSLMIYGEMYISSGVASIIFANMPIIMLITSVILLCEKISLTQILGLTIALAALLNILINESRISTESNWQGIFAIVIALIMHAVVYTVCKKNSCTVPIVTFNALPCFFAGIILSMLGWIFEKPQIENFSVYSILSIIYLGVFAGVSGIMCYFLLQKKAKAFQASLVFLIFPLIAVGMENYIYGSSMLIKSKLMLIPLALGIIITLLPRKAV